MKKLLLFIILFSFSATAQIRVVDGDSLEINNKKIRLIGIDAPEYYQTCFDEDGLEYDCGFDALEYLQNLIEKGLQSHTPHALEGFKTILKTTINQVEIRGL